MVYVIKFKLVLHDLNIKMHEKGLFWNTGRFIKVS